MNVTVNSARQFSGWGEGGSDFVALVSSTFANKTLIECC